MHLNLEMMTNSTGSQDFASNATRGLIGGGEPAKQ